MSPAQYNSNMTFKWIADIFTLPEESAAIKSPLSARSSVERTVINKEETTQNVEHLKTE
ncbi:hypothetical protein RR48_12531 [Papilio machaon]|uniref:Uncharacterized protein n=1 Tax=Papilio machaon TaxID=76193 RepID=A0A194RNX2_PAPMA|nr:hypothetical protein RR48_12531 [Papilio machaon]